MILNIDSIDKESFFIKSGLINDIPCYLINPNLTKVSWSQDNLIFRSSIWDFSGNLLSAGFKKFFNFSESPHLYPDPEKFSNWQVIEKIDGSLMICDFINNELSVRTRGTFSYKSLDNFYDFEIAYQKYNILSLCKNEPQYSFLFEIVSPNNKIIFNYGPDINIYLIGVINKNDYSILEQDKLDYIAKKFNFKRPKRYKFNNLAEMISDVKEWRRQEGVVLYYGPKENNLLKFKADYYIFLHKIKNKLNSKESLLDLFLDLNEPSYSYFYKYISDEFDFEIAKSSEETILKIIKAKEEIDLILHSLNRFVENRKVLSRKQFAIDALRTYKESPFKILTSLCFKVWDNKEINNEDKKKLYIEFLNKEENART